MGFVRKYIRWLLNLGRPPDVLTASELVDYAGRRWLLRIAMVPLLIPPMLALIFGVPWLKKQVHRAKQTCSTAIPHADIEAWAGGPATRRLVRAGPYGCEAEWTVNDDIVLSIQVLTTGGLTFDGLKAELTSRRTDMEVWDWDRPERVRVIHRPNGHETAVVDLEPRRVPFEPPAIVLTTTSTERQASTLVTQALEDSEASLTYVTWLDGD